MSNKHFRGYEQPTIASTCAQRFAADDAPAPQYGDAMPSRDVGSDHGMKTPELRTLIARCLRAQPQLFVLETGSDRYTIKVRDRAAIPRTKFVEDATYIECMKYLDSLATPS